MTYLLTRLRLPEQAFPLLGLTVGPESPAGTTAGDGLTVFRCPEQALANDAMCVAPGELTLGLACAISKMTAPCVGFILHKVTSTTCVIVSHAELSGFPPAAARQPIFLSLQPGKTTTTAPVGTNVVVQRLGEYIGISTIRAAVTGRYITRA